MELFRSAAMAESVFGSRIDGDLGEDCPELVEVVMPFAAKQDHGHGDDPAEDGGDAKGVEGDGRPDPGADAGQQFDVAGAHAADGVGGQQQAQPDGRPQQAQPRPTQPKQAVL